jgi:hypothetical protein
MKFLIQKIDGEVRHDFSITLLESIRFKGWLGNRINVKYFNTHGDDPIIFKPFHSSYVPVGSVEFVSEFLKHFYNISPKPKNIPDELFQCVNRPVFNGTEKDVEKLVNDKWFIKSNDKIKGYTELVKIDDTNRPKLPKGNYQFSEFIKIDSEWRAFVYQSKLVGLQNYSGDFTVFPNVFTIKDFISNYKSAPVAYTLDVSVEEFNHFKTDVIEVHDFFSCGLYGFADHGILPNMFYRWFIEYLKNNNVLFR